jgi:hypothetical protein
MSSFYASATLTFIDILTTILLLLLYFYNLGARTCRTTATLRAFCTLGNRAAFRRIYDGWLFDSYPSPICARSRFYIYQVLSYTTLHYTTLNYTTRHYTTLHYTALHDTTLHCTTLHYTKLHYTKLHSTKLH